MPTEPDPHHVHNLRRWEESGQPQTWIEAHAGRWDHADWQSLVLALRQSEFWPLDLDAVGRTLEGLKGYCGNVRRWAESGGPRRWIEARRGRWGHDDWLALLADLRASEFWPLEPEVIGHALEEARLRLLNLRRWERSGQAVEWVDARQGQWGHEDWLALIDSLRQSSFWPLDAEAVKEVLSELQQEWHNLRRWHESGQTVEWVAARGGRWSQEDWLALRDRLQRSEFWPLNPEEAEKVLGRVTAEWCNLRRWQESGQPWLWVKGHAGLWNHAKWLALLDSLRESQYWPLDTDAVARVLEQVKREYENLRSWVESGQPRQWAEARRGRWGHEDLQALVAALQHSEFWPLNPALALLELDATHAESRNLRRWQESGEAWKWVEAQEALWGEGDWRALLDGLRRSEFWPVDTEAVGRVMTGLKVQWWNLRRWRASGLARRWVEARQGRWAPCDLLALPEELRAVGLWPVDMGSLARVLEEVRAEWAAARKGPLLATHSGGSAWPAARASPAPGNPARLKAAVP